MLNSNFTFTFDKINENFLVGTPLLENFPFRWEQRTKADVMYEIVIQAVGEFLLLNNTLYQFIVFLFVIRNSTDYGDDFIWKTKLKGQEKIETKSSLFIWFSSEAKQ